MAANWFKDPKAEEFRHSYTPIDTYIHLCFFSSNILKDLEDLTHNNRKHEILFIQ